MTNDTAHVGRQPGLPRAATSRRAEAPPPWSRPRCGRSRPRLAERMESPVGAIPQVGAHLLGAGGKRLRPLLAVLAARAAGAPSTSASRSAAPPS